MRETVEVLIMRCKSPPRRQVAGRGYRRRHWEVTLGSALFLALTPACPSADDAASPRAESTTAALTQAPAAQPDATAGVEPSPDEEAARLREISEKSHEYNSYPFKPLPSAPSLSVPTLADIISRAGSRRSKPSTANQLVTSRGAPPPVSQKTRDRYAEFARALETEQQAWAHVGAEEKRLRRAQLKARIILGIQESPLGIQESPAPEVTP